jgi:phosphoribosylaminoimidazolecarboxamide formyltransferase/IMP cyclohydrolase
MHEGLSEVKTALLSVSNKDGIVELAQRLFAAGVMLLSTGGTCRVLREAGVEVTEVSDYTQFPEIMDGRVKTLHPKIHGGILGLREEHALVASQHSIPWIDLVVCNLYPFAQTIQKPAVSFDEVIENIDIGGPSMVRGAAKNMGWVSILVDPDDYASYASSLEEGGAISFATRKRLAIKAFQHTAYYDAMIARYLGEDLFPQTMTLAAERVAVLRYGENPHQKAAVYRDPLSKEVSLLHATQHQGKALSYNNYVDAEAALACVMDFQQTACVIVKHANPCGVACAADGLSAFKRALAADSLSAFGGIVALNTAVDKAIAMVMRDVFFEVIIAPAFSEEALVLLSKKKNLRVLSLATMQDQNGACSIKSLRGGFLVQTQDDKQADAIAMNVVTQVIPTEAMRESLGFAWQVVKHVKSNAILIAKDEVSLGVGAGQVSRVDAVKLAIQKTQGQSLQGAVLASDAFFPFRDAIDMIAASGIKAIVQPGGSVKDAEVIQACDEHGIAMVFTGQRCFNH